MSEFGMASDNDLAAALSLGYLVVVLILLQYSLRFLLLNNALASRSISISSCSMSHS